MCSGYVNVLLLLWKLVFNLRLYFVWKFDVSFNWYDYMYFLIFNEYCLLVVIKELDINEYLEVCFSERFDCFSTL